MKTLTACFALLLSCNLAGCGQNAEHSKLNDVSFYVEEVQSEHSGFGISASYRKQIRIEATGVDLFAGFIMDGIFTHDATGANGICPSCTSSTPTNEQNSGDLIYAEGVVPGNMVSPITGTARIVRTGAASASVSMRSLTNSLTGTIVVEVEHSRLAWVTESGRTTGPFAGTFARGHNQYFDLNSAVRRGLYRTY